MNPFSPLNHPRSLAEGPVRATLARSPATDAPGVKFLVAATTALEDENATPLEGVRVAVSIVPANASSAANCSAAARAALAAQKCETVSGRPALDARGRGCELELPCAGDFLLRACALAFANGTAIKGGLAGAPPCSTSPIGRNTSAWAAAPWAAQPRLQLLADRANYTLGGTAVLSFAVPAYSGPTAGLLVWGNADGTRRRVIPRLPPGAARIEVPLGPECRGGCKAALTLAAGRPSAGGAAPPRAVPVSKLFDPLAPHTLSASVELRVLGDDRLDVTLSVTSDGDNAPAAGRAAGEEAAVVPPMGGGRISVLARDADSGAPAAGAEARGLARGVVCLCLRRAPRFTPRYPPARRAAKPPPSPAAARRRHPRNPGDARHGGPGQSGPHAVRPQGARAAAARGGGSVSPRRRAGGGVEPCGGAALAGRWLPSLPSTQRPPLSPPKQDLPAALAPANELYLSLKDINAARAGRGALNATFAALARRLEADPWLPLVTTVTPSPAYELGSWGEAAYYPGASPVDVPDGEYIARFSSPATVTPFYGWCAAARGGRHV